MTLQALLSKVSSAYIVMGLTKSDEMGTRMTRIQSEAAKARYRREALRICPSCNGSGVVVSESVKAKAKRGGVNSYLKSLQPGQPSMVERGRLGGRPKGPTIADLLNSDRGME